MSKAASLGAPSKRVEDRFKGVEIEFADATPLTGFITDQNAETVTLADREQVHRIPRSRIRSINPQSSSLMPDKLLNRLSWDELSDLLAFLEDKNAAGIEFLFKKNKIDYIRAEATLEKAGEVKVKSADGKEETHTAPKMLLISAWKIAGSV